MDLSFAKVSGLEKCETSVFFLDSSGEKERRERERERKERKKKEKRRKRRSGDLFFFLSKLSKRCKIKKKETVQLAICSFSTLPIPSLFKKLEIWKNEKKKKSKKLATFSRKLLARAKIRALMICLLFFLFAVANRVFFLFLFLFLFLWVQKNKKNGKVDRKSRW